jgi:transposase
MSKENVMDDVRLRRPERDQYQFASYCIDDLVSEDHAVRIVWHVVERLDLSRFHATIQARGSDPGRSATDPRVLIALWLYATIQGIGHGRELARLCQEHNAYRWLCGGLTVNYHTLNDFRVNNGTSLDELLTQVVAGLTHQGLVSVDDIAQDGTRVESRASLASFSRAETLQEHLKAARVHIRRVADTASPAQQRGMNQRTKRLEQALKEIEEIRQIKEGQRDKPSKKNAPQVSATDPDARLMRFPRGGFRPGYNVQLAVDPGSRAIVGVDVTNSGNDANESEPMRCQVERRTGQRVRRHLIDGGYSNLKAFDRAEGSGVAIYSPPRTKSVRRDSPNLARWRRRMDTPSAKALYAQRGPACERINGDLKSYRGLGRFVVCGLPKVRSIALWSVLAYNVLTFGKNCVT